MEECELKNNRLRRISEQIEVEDMMSFMSRGKTPSEIDEGNIEEIQAEDPGNVLSDKKSKSNEDDNLSLGFNISANID